MKLSEELTWRGFINQTTYPDLAVLDGEPISLYFGVDPSADGMTIGNLASAMMVRHFIDHGHKVYLLVGGATGMIGDPDGKKDERNLKTLEEIQNNVEAIAKEYNLIFAGKEFTVVNNYDWFKDINYLDFLRLVGKHTSMSQMLSRDFIQSRLGENGSGISYAEFSYSLIQGYDFLHLYKEYGITLQLCGADQWGNSITGVDLIRRIEGGEAHVYSAPLVVNKQTGVKFGKSEGGAVWLNPHKTSPYAFYQFWLNLDDETAEDMIKKYTVLTQDQANDVIQEHSRDRGKRVLQRRLAYEVTSLIHGAPRADSVERVTLALFGDESVSSLRHEDLEALANEIPEAPIGGSVISILTSSGAAKSSSEAKRLLSSGAISINGHKVQEDAIITETSLVKKGKNSFVLVR